MPRRSPFRALGLAIAATLAFAAPGLAGSEGDITFRVTIRGGTIPDADDFSLSINDLTPPETVISPGFLCGPGSGNYNPSFVACETRDYDWVISTDASFEIGDAFLYSFAKDGQTLRRGTVALTPGSQVVSVVYDYDTGRVLPDTSMIGAAPTQAPVPVGWILAAIGGLFPVFLYSMTIVSRSDRRPAAASSDSSSRRIQ